MSAVQVATNRHCLKSMPVNLAAQYQGTVESFNNRINIAQKITYSLLTCRAFHKLNQNIFFMLQF